MFTIEQIRTAQEKVRTGADFPSYIKEIKTLGVTSYENQVINGQVTYQGKNNYTTKTPPKYEPLTISNIPNKEQFKKGLKEHQQGKTDFTTFVNLCATTGIQTWKINTEQMTCTYYDKKGKKILQETIPE